MWSVEPDQLQYALPSYKRDYKQQLWQPNPFNCFPCPFKDNNKNITGLQFTWNATNYREEVCLLLPLWGSAAPIHLRPQQNNERARITPSLTQPAFESANKTPALEPKSEGSGDGWTAERKSDRRGRSEAALTLSTEGQAEEAASPFASYYSYNVVSVHPRASQDFLFLPLQIKISTCTTEINYRHQAGSSHTLTSSEWGVK